MAIAFSPKEHLNQTVYIATIISGETGTTDSEYFDASGFEAMTFHVDGVSGETLKIYGSNAPTQPTPTATAVVQLGSDITASGIYTVVTPVNWIKIAITSGGAGTVNVYFLGVPKKTR